MNSKLRVHAWHDGPGRVLFQAEVDGRQESPKYQGISREGARD